MKNKIILMKDILIVAHFCGDFDGTDNNRFNYLADLLSKNHHIELVTTEFSHSKKIKYKKLNGKYNYKITRLHEPVYKKNVSLKRFYSHYIFSRNLKKYLRYRKKPDIIYCAVPSLAAASIVASYSKKNNIRFIIDVQDLWPEAFKMIFHFPIIDKILFEPMRKKANFVYKVADDIVTVSQIYAERTLSVSKKCNKASCVYLGTELPKFDYFKKKYEYKTKPKNEIWIVYIGTLGHSYDLICVIDALKLLNKEGINNFRFIVMGDGPLKTRFENYARVKNVSANFLGKLEYSNMVGMLVSCDIAINPIVKGSAGSILNKVCDYAAASLPVINTQECKEYSDLLIKYKAGYNCRCGDSRDVANKILELIKNKNLMNEFRKNSRELAEKYFNREVTYKVIENLLLKGYE